MKLIGLISVVLLVCIIYYLFHRYKSSTTQPSYISFKESKDLVGLPIVTFYSGTHKLHFLLDTGADKSTFSIQHLDLVNYTELNAYAIVTDASGAQARAGIVSFSIFYENKSYSNIFRVVDMSPITEAIDLQVKGQRVDIVGIIGDDFLTKYKYVLDFDKMIAYSKL